MLYDVIKNLATRANIESSIQSMMYHVHYFSFASYTSSDQTSDNFWSHMYSYNRLRIKSWP